MHASKVQILLARRSTFGLDQLHALRQWLLNTYNGELQPERIDPYHPLRSSFASTPIEKWHEWLTFNSSANVVEILPNGTSRPMGVKLDSWGEFYLERKTKRGHLDGSVHNDPQGLPYRGRFQMSFNPQLVRGFSEEVFAQEFIGVIEAVSADYGMLTSEDDYRLQNYVETQCDRGGTSCRWIGDNLTSGIPGLYWLNVWPTRIESLLHRVDPGLLNELARVETREGHIVIRRLTDLWKLTTDEGVAQREAIKSLFGRELFCSIESSSESGGLRDPFE